MAANRQTAAFPPQIVKAQLAQRATQLVRILQPPVVIAQYEIDSVTGRQTAQSGWDPAEAVIALENVPGDCHQVDFPSSRSVHDKLEIRTRNLSGNVQVGKMQDADPGQFYVYAVPLK